VTVNNNEVSFDDIDYTLYAGNGYTSLMKNEFLDHGDFLYIFAGMNYGSFDENIIWKRLHRKSESYDHERQQ
jgi:hypothetical protein